MGRPRKHSFRFSEKTVEAINDPPRTPAGRGVWYFDEGHDGLVLIAYPSRKEPIPGGKPRAGRRVFFYRYTFEGRRRCVRVGPWPAVSVEKARERCLKIQAEVTGGTDPYLELAQRKKTPLFKEWIPVVVSRLELRGRRTRDVAMYLKAAGQRWGTLRLDLVTPADVEAFIGKIGEEHPTSANRALSALRVFFSHAVKDGKLKTNPAGAVEPLREPEPRQRAMTDEELKRFLEAVAAEPDPVCRAFWRVMVETAARLGELLNTRWRDLDLVNGVWILPKTKSRRPQALPLARSTVEMLKRLPRTGDFVFAGEPPEQGEPERPRHDMKRPWRRLLKAAKIEGLHVHDVRRTVALRIANADGSLAASRVLRHSSSAVTEKHYVPIQAEHVRATLERHIASLPEPKEAKGAV